MDSLLSAQNAYANEAKPLFYIPLSGHAGWPSHNHVWRWKKSAFRYSGRRMYFLISVEWQCDVEKDLLVCEAPLFPEWHRAKCIQYRYIKFVFPADRWFLRSDSYLE